MSAWMVGIDTGGTFTDLIAFNVGSGELRIAKVPSAPDDPSRAVMAALDDLFGGAGRVGERAGAEIDPGDISFLAHGTTVATNAILEGKGATTGLMITRGFRAVYEARGWAQPDPDDLLDPFYAKPLLLAPQRLTEEITERLDYQGDIITPLDEDDVRVAAHRLREAGVGAIAICFLFSFRNAAHEERAARIIREEAPGIRVSVSSLVLPTIREYPRLSTTVIDAFIGPIMENYLSRLDTSLGEAGVTTPQKFLMQSNGGLMRINMGARFPNQTLLSGPAGGVVSGLELARLTGRDNIVTFDMGGTSADIGLITGNRADETDSGRIAGQDIGSPMLAVHTLGAGGGTIAWIGGDGLMKIGPRSAGAHPGPACYGNGGEDPTVTDANLLLGALGSGSTLGGRMAIEPALAEAAIRAKVADPLGLTVIEAAAGIIRIVNTHMAVDLRLVFQKRGEDARRFAMAAFGGAGPLHAALLARELGVPDVIVPLYPGLNSAMGLLQTSVRHVYVRSMVGLLSAFDPAEIDAGFAELVARAMTDIAEEGFREADVVLTRQLDMRYPHQGYQLAIDCPDGPFSEDSRQPLKRDFDATHGRVYGASAPDEDAEIVTFRVIAEIETPRLALPKIQSGDGDPSDAITGERDLYDFGTASFDVATIFDRSKLRAGDGITGPAIIEQFDSTTIVLAGQSARVDGIGNLIIHTGAAS